MTVDTTSSSRYGIVRSCALVLNQGVLFFTVLWRDYAQGGSMLSVIIRFCFSDNPCNEKQQHTK